MTGGDDMKISVTNKKENIEEYEEVVAKYFEKYHGAQSGIPGAVRLEPPGEDDRQKFEEDISRIKARSAMADEDDAGDSTSETDS